MTLASYNYFFSVVTLIGVDDKRIDTNGKLMYWNTIVVGRLRIGKFSHKAPVDAIDRNSIDVL